MRPLRHIRISSKGEALLEAFSALEQGARIYVYRSFLALSFRDLVLYVAWWPRISMAVFK